MFLDYITSITIIIGLLFGISGLLYCGVACISIGIKNKHSLILLVGIFLLIMTIILISLGILELFGIV